MSVDVGSDQARYEVLSGEPLALLHHGEPIKLAPMSPQTLDIPPLPEPPAVNPPPGREASRRGVGTDLHDAQMQPQRHRD